MSRHRLRDDLRPRSAWLTLWLIIHRTALAGTGYAAWFRSTWRWQLAALAVYGAAAALVYLLAGLFNPAGLR